MYHIDPASYGSVFVLPKKLTEEDLILAPGAILKALLFAYAAAKPKKGSLKKEK